ncbi:hypothetical protein COOONC_20860 [Cooperia oncophora]
MAVISALSLLNSDAQSTLKMQSKISAALNEFDVELLPSLIDLLIRRLDVSSKGAFTNLLVQLSTNLHVNQLRIRRTGKLRLTLFDVLLSVNLLALRTCPLSAANAIRQRLLSPQDSFESLSGLFGEALKFNYANANISSIISIAQHSLWSAKENAQKFGAKLFKELFLASPKNRELTLKTMLSHSVHSEGESEAVLCAFKELVDANPEAIEPFMPLISEYFFILGRMSMENLKRFFRAIFRLYAARPSTMTHKDNLNDMIPLFLHSADNVHPIFGVGGCTNQAGDGAAA